MGFPGLCVDDLLKISGAQLPEFLFVERLEYVIRPLIGFYAPLADLPEVLGLPFLIYLRERPIINLINAPPLQPRQRLEGGCFFIVVSDDDPRLCSDPRARPAALQFIDCAGSIGPLQRLSRLRRLPLPAPRAEGRTVRYLLLHLMQKCIVSPSSMDD